MAIALYGTGLYGVDVYGEVTVPDGGTLDTLELVVEVVKPDGRRYLWDAHGYAEDVPTAVGFSTKRMEGFSTFSCTLARRGDQDHPDIELRDELNVLSASGDIVWEGRVTAAPMSLDDDGWSIDVQATGWMASAKDRKLSDIYVDRDTAHWKEPALARQVVIATAGQGQTKFQASSGQGGLSWAIPNETLPIVETKELHYDAGAAVVAKVMYKGSRTGAFTDFAAPFLYSDDSPTLPSATATALTLDGTLRTATPAAAERYLMIQATTTGSTTPGAGWLQKLDQVAVYGGQVPTHPNGTEPDGVYASEVMEHLIDTYCPKLTWAGNDSTYPISQLAFRDLTYPYDALLACNAFHLLDLACWENRTVHWAPVDLSDWDWEVSLDDPGFKVTLEGDTDDGSGYNGIVIQYTDLLTGETRILWPDEHDELRDDDELNPANRHGDQHWADETLTHPCLEADALQMGRAILAERNQPKSPGQYTIRGHIRNRQGVWQPAWKVRSGQRIVIPNHPNRRPRLITETAWANDSKTLTLATDSAIQRVDAWFDRLGTSLTAAGLS